MTPLQNKIEEAKKEWLKEAKYPGDPVNPKLGCCGGDYCEHKNFDEGHNNFIADWWLDKLTSIATLAQKEARKDEYQFFLNILDGVDRADEQMSVNGETKAIRHALQIRMAGHGINISNNTPQ